MHAKSLESSGEDSVPLVPAATPRRVPLWVFTTAAGLVAGLAAAVGGEAAGNAVPVLVEFPPGYEQMGGYQKNSVRSEAVGRAEKIAEKKKAAAAYGLLGLLLGVGLGVVGGLAAGSPRQAVLGTVIGALAGGVAGAGVSFAAVPLFFRYQDPEFGGMLGLFLAHAAIFVAIGAAGGLALGYAVDRRVSLGPALSGGALGALAGTFLFETVDSLAFPLMRTYEPVPSEQLPRFLAHLIIAACVGLVAGLAVGTPRRTKTTPPAG
jgi:hypothetical protein